MKKFNILFFAFILITASSTAQEGEFTPKGKPVLRIFSNFHSTFAEGERGSAFELKRVYLGYEHNFSKHLSGAAVLDVGDPGVGKLQMTAYVKNAYLKYKKSKLTVNFGLISTTQFNLQESAWGYRYLEKSFQDEYKFNSSADLGVSAAYKITDFLSADVIVANGEGYKKIESDSALRTGFGVTLTPVKNFTARAYYDFSTNVNRQTSIATFLEYATDKFSLGAEYMLQIQPDFIAERQWSGTSFFGTLKLANKLKLFGRYDRLTSNTVAGETSNWNLSGDGQTFIGGLEFSPAKGIKLAPNFKGWSPADNSKTFVSTVILNIEVKF
jgi:hypothetical protein